LGLYFRTEEDGLPLEEIRGEEEYERMAGGEEDETGLFLVELSVRIRRVELWTELDETLFERGAIDDLYPLEGAAAPGLTLRLLLRLPEETREPEAARGSPDTVRAFRPDGLPESRGEASAVRLPWLRLKLEGRIWGFIVWDPEGTAFWSPELRKAGLMSGCLACRVRSPSREACVRLRATLEM
jgi:hypothetical protein